jgi:hypothetical protein
MFVRNLVRGAAVIAATAGLAFSVASAAGASVATPAAAHVAAAASINGPIYNPIEVGYEQHSTIVKNQIRGTVSIPAGSPVSQCVGLQENANGGKTVALCLLFNPAQNGFDLAYLHGTLHNFNTGAPFGSVSFGSLVPVATLGTPAGHMLFSRLVGGSYYLEVRLSTLHNVVNLVAGPNENDAATLGTSFGGFTANGFSAPFIGGVDFFSGLLSANTPLASWTRIGTTTWKSGARVTFDNESLDLSESLLHCNIISCANTIGNHVTMLPGPALPGVGSAWSEVSGS